MRPYTSPFLLVHQAEHISQLSLAHSLVARLGHDQLVQQWRCFADLIPLHHHIIGPALLLSSQVQLLRVHSSWHAAAELASLIGRMSMARCARDRASPVSCCDRLPTAQRIGLWSRSWGNT